MANEKKYTLKERAEYYAKLAKKGESKDGKKMTEAQKAACIVKAGKLQERATREAKRYEQYKESKR